MSQFHRIKEIKEFLMKKIVISITILIGLVILAACASTGSQGGGSLTGVVWMLDNLNGKPPVTGTMISAEFTTDGKVSGTAGCNTYAGQYTASGSSIQFTAPMASTMMACDQPVMDQETAYFQALAAAKSFAVNGDKLTLKDSSGTVVASYTAQSQDLSGSSWLATGYNNGKQAVVSVATGTELTAVFGKDGNMSGTAGCNNYSGPYKVDGSKITIGPLAATMMFCDNPAGVMDQEAQYLAALQSASTYQIEGNQMTMRTADDAMAATFIRK
jgi:heat shock protein HslJ